MDILSLLDINYTITWLSDTLMKVTPVAQMTIDILPQTSEMEIQMGPSN